LALLLLSHACSINVVIYAAVSVYAGSWRSVQVDPPEGKEIMTHKEAAKFPLVSGLVQHLWPSPAIQQLLQLLLMLQEAADTSSACWTAMRQLSGSWVCHSHKHSTNNTRPVQLQQQLL
jgi:hypothetical protein